MMTHKQKTSISALIVIAVWISASELALSSPSSKNPSFALETVMSGKFRNYDFDNSTDNPNWISESRFTKTSPDKKYVSQLEHDTAGNAILNVFDKTSKRLVFQEYTFPRSYGEYFRSEDFYWSKDSKKLIFCSENSLMLFDVDTQKTAMVATPEIKVYFCAYNPILNLVAVSGSPIPKNYVDTEVRIINLANLKETARVTLDMATGIKWSPDGKLLAIELSDRAWTRIVFTDMSLKTISDLWLRHPFQWFSWSANGKYLAGLDQEQHQLILVDRKSKKPIQILEAPIAPRRLAWSCDGREIKLQMAGDKDASKTFKLAWNNTNNSPATTYVIKTSDPDNFPTTPEEFYKIYDERIDGMTKVLLKMAPDEKSLFFLYEYLKLEDGIKRLIYSGGEFYYMDGPIAFHFKRKLACEALITGYWHYLKDRKCKPTK